MRRSSVTLVLLLAACSSGSVKTHVGAPGTEPPTSASPRPQPVATHAPAPTRTPAPTASPAPRRTAAALPTAAPVATASPSPRPVKTASPKPSPTRAGTTWTITAMTGYRFSPSSLTVRVGDYALVKDTDSTAPHNFQVNGTTSPDMSAGDSFRYRFGSVGTFQFVCTHHQAFGMTGTVTVKA